MERFDIDTHGHIAGEGLRARNYVSNGLLLLLDSDQMKQHLTAKRQPFRATDGRMVRITGGRATYRINLEEYSMMPHDVLIIPPQSIIEMMDCNDDFTIEVLAVSSLPGISQERLYRAIPSSVQHLSLSDDDWQRQTAFIHLLASLLDAEPVSMVSVAYLIRSLVSDLQRIEHTAKPSQSVRKASKGEEKFHQFLRLAHEHGFRERNVTFYSDRLLVTPNHLSAIVRQQSGQTVIDWLTERTLTEARILLRHTDLMMYEIAERLCFPEATAFGRYFKKQTGMTPLEYREKG